MTLAVCPKCHTSRSPIAIEIRRIRYGALFNLCHGCGHAWPNDQLNGEVWETASLYAQRHNEGRESA